MKNNLIYFLLLIILAALTYYFVFAKDQEVFAKSEVNFTIKDTSKVMKIFLTNPQNEQVKLTRTNGMWILNDSMQARQDAINNLLSVLHEQKAEQPVTVAYHDDVISDLSANNTKIELYDAKGKTNTFYVGKNPGPSNETYMLNEGAKRPYIVKLPLQNTFVGVRYFTSPSDWRTKQILSDSSPLQSVDVHYKDSVKYSFNLSKQAVTGNYDIDIPLNQSRVDSYLKLMSNLYCMGYENEYAYKDSTIKEGVELAIVTFITENNHTQQMQIFFKPPRQGTKGIIKIGNKEFDQDAFFGYINYKDLVVISRTTVEKILRRYAEFYEKDTP